MPHGFRIMSRNLFLQFFQYCRKLRIPSRLRRPFFRRAGAFHRRYVQGGKDRVIPFVVGYLFPDFFFRDRLCAGRYLFRRRLRNPVIGRRVLFHGTAVMMRAVAAAQARKLVFGEYPSPLGVVVLVDTNHIGIGCPRPAYAFCRKGAVCILHDRCRKCHGAEAFYDGSLVGNRIAGTKMHVPAAVQHSSGGIYHLVGGVDGQRLSRGHDGRRHFVHAHRYGFYGL